MFEKKIFLKRYFFWFIEIKKKYQKIKSHLGQLKLRKLTFFDLKLPMLTQIKVILLVKNDFIQF